MEEMALLSKLNSYSPSSLISLAVISFGLNIAYTNLKPFHYQDQIAEMAQKSKKQLKPVLEQVVPKISQNRYNKILVRLADPENYIYIEIQKDLEDSDWLADYQKHYEYAYDRGRTHAEWAKNFSLAFLFGMPVLEFASLVFNVRLFLEQTLVGILFFIFIVIFGASILWPLSYMRKGDKIVRRATEAIESWGNELKKEIEKISDEEKAKATGITPIE